MIDHRAPARPRGPLRAAVAAAVLAALAVSPAAAAPAPDAAAGGAGTGGTAPPPPAPARTGMRTAPEVAGYDWPLDGPARPTRGFDAPENPYGPGHRGVDLAAAPGAVVRAAGPGTVAFAGPVAGRGVVSIDHAPGLRTTYEPLTPAVAAGDEVRTGTVIGTLTAGHPGCPAAACLHWGLRTGDGYRDPRTLLGTVTVRLLPV